MVRVRALVPRPEHGVRLVRRRHGMVFGEHDDRHLLLFFRAGLLALLSDDALGGVLLVVRIRLVADHAVGER